MNGVKTPRVRRTQQIEEDYQAIRNNQKRKMSEYTLRYLRQERVVKNPTYFAQYMAATERIEDRHRIEDSIIDTCNSKLIWWYEHL